MGNVHMEATQINYRGGSKKMSVSDEIDSLKSGLTNLTDAVGWDNHYNQWDETWEVGSIDTTTGANVENSTVIRSKGYISITPNTSYYFKSPNVAVAFFYDSNKSYIAQSSVNIWEAFTAPANAYYMRFRLSSDYGNTYNNNVSINYPSTITGYYAGHPVIGDTLTELDTALSVPDGAGKNLLPMTLDGIKAANTDGTWSGNTYTYNGISYTINTDSNGNATSITVNGTASANSVLYITNSYDLTQATGKILNGMPSEAGIANLVFLAIAQTNYPWTGYADIGYGVTIGSFTDNNGGI